MGKRGREKQMGKGRTVKDRVRTGCLLCIAVCLFMGILAGEKTQALDQSILLGTQEGNDINVK